MKFGSPFCAKCGEPAAEMVETITGLASLQAPDEDGESAYGGETEVEWDSQHPAKDEDGLVTLLCCNKHEWFSTIQE